MFERFTERARKVIILVTDGLHTSCPRRPGTMLDDQVASAADAGNVTSDK